MHGKIISARVRIQMARGVDGTDGETKEGEHMERVERVRVQMEKPEYRWLKGSIHIEN